MSQQGSPFGPWTTGALAKAKSQEEYDRILKTVPRIKMAGARLEDFGYFYNEDLELRQIAKPDEPFAWLGQKHYDFLGEAIYEELYTMLEQKYGFRRIMLPLDEHSAKVPPPVSTMEKPRTPVFVTPNYSSCEQLIVMIEGVGAVRGPVWARSLCINNSLRDGTMFPYIEFFLSQGFGIIITNPNDNNFSPIALSSAPARHLLQPPLPSAAAVAAANNKKNNKKNKNEDDAASKGEENEDDDEADDNKKSSFSPIPLTQDVGDYWLATSDTQWKNLLSKALRSAPEVEGSESQEDHGCYVWENLVQPSAAKCITICAHSYGGRVTTSVLDEFFDSSVKQRVACVAWTDAINDNFRNSQRSNTNALTKWLKKNSRNYVASDKPLGTQIPTREGFDEVSSGHKVHEWTSSCAAPHLFRFVMERNAAFLEKLAHHGNAATATTNNNNNNNEKNNNNDHNQDAAQ